MCLSKTRKKLDPNIPKLTNNGKNIKADWEISLGFSLTRQLESFGDSVGCSQFRLFFSIVWSPKPKLKSETDMSSYF